MYTISMYIQFGTLLRGVISQHHSLINSLSICALSNTVPLTYHQFRFMSS